MVERFMILDACNIPDREMKNYFQGGMMMSKYAVGVFPTYQDAKKASEELENISKEAVILNKLRNSDKEDNSPKLDGLISGVSDVFLGLPVFVNPLSAAGLPPQPDPSESAERQWANFGFTKEEAAKYEDLMEQGKTILAVKSDEYEDQIVDTLNQCNSLETWVHEF
jgi:hypothetical protein